MLEDCRPYVLVSKVRPSIRKQKIARVPVGGGRVCQKLFGKCFFTRNIFKKEFSLDQLSKIESRDKSDVKPNDNTGLELIVQQERVPTTCWSSQGALLGTTRFEQPFNLSKAFLDYDSDLTYSFLFVSWFCKIHILTSSQLVRKYIQNPINKTFFTTRHGFVHNCEGSL